MVSAAAQEAAQSGKSPVDVFMAEVGRMGWDRELAVVFGAGERGEFQDAARTFFRNATESPVPPERLGEPRTIGQAGVAAAVPGEIVQITVQTGERTMRFPEDFIANEDFWRFFPIERARRLLKESSYGGAPLRNLRDIALTVDPTIDGTMRLTLAEDGKRVEAAFRHGPRLIDMLRVLNQLITVPEENVAFTPREYARRLGATLHADDEARIDDTIRWRKLDYDDADRRAFTWNLRHEPSVRTPNGIVRYRNAKAKASTDFCIAPPSTEPYRPQGHPAGRILVQPDGRITFEEREWFRGGLYLEDAVNEAGIMEQLHQRGLAIDLPYKTGEYPDRKFKGARTGNVVILTPGEEVTVEKLVDKVIDGLVKPLQGAASGERAARLNRSIIEMGGRSGFKKAMEGLFFRYGERLRELHDAGYYHGTPHFNNIKRHNNRFFWKDFSYSRHIGDEPAGRKAAYRLIDLYMTFEHLPQMGFMQELRRYPEFQELFPSLPVEHLTLGYFSDRLSDRRVKQVTPEMIQSTFQEGMGRPVSQINNPLTQLLNDMSWGHVPEDKHTIAGGPLVYVYPMTSRSGVDVLNGIMQAGNINRHIDRLGKNGVISLTLEQLPIEKPKAAWDQDSRGLHILLPRGLGHEQTLEFIMESCDRFVEKQEGKRGHQR